MKWLLIIIISGIIIAYFVVSHNQVAAERVSEIKEKNYWDSSQRESEKRIREKELELKYEKEKLDILKGKHQ